MMKKRRMKVAALVLFAGGSLTTMAVAEPVVLAKTVTYQVVTNEISAKQTNGSKVEVYRFDPAVYPVAQGDEVVLRIRGVKGHQHNIMLENYNLRATVNRNETTEIRFRADKPGVYRLICLTHQDENHEGPMEGYLVVIPSNVNK